MSPHAFRTLLAAAVLATASVAAADDAGDALKRGKAALKAGDVHQACVELQAAVDLDPKVESKALLADCLSKDGKPVAAAKLYRELAEADAKKHKTYAAKADKLEANAPRLRFAINPKPDGLVLKVDGNEVPADKDLPVDAGPHDVVASAPGFEGRTSAAVDKDRGVIDVIVRLEATAPPKPPEPVAKPIEDPAPMPKPAETEEALPAAAQDTQPVPAPMEPPAPRTESHRGRNGVIVGVAGVAALAGAGILFASSASKFEDEHALCPGNTCRDQADADRANALSDDARTLRGTSYIVGGVGAVLVGVGAYMLLTRPSESATQMTLQVGDGGATFALGGRF